jgi:Tfp pilus assembly protein PilF
MTIQPARLLALFLATASIGLALPAHSATPAPKATAKPAPAASAAVVKERNDYADVRFTTPLSAGLKHFYAREFKTALVDFESALKVVPDNTLAISFLNAAAVQQQGELDVITNLEEDASSGAPKNYVNRVRLGFSYMFAPRDRSIDAREELNAAVALNPDGAAAHVGLGILRFNERSANRAKTEMLAALKTDPNNVLAREYLAQIYQSDLRDAQRGFSYAVDVPNLVPGYADIQFHLGSLMHDLKQSDAAITYLKRGIELDTGHVGEAGLHGYTLIARIYIEQKKFKEAQKALDDAVKADVDVIYAKALLAKLKNGDYASPSPTPRK